MPGLYGLEKGRSNRNPSKFWTKNCFNSCFPVSLALYMMDNKIPVNYIYLDANGDVKVRNMKVRELFNMGKRKTSDDLYFEFEKKFEPYERFALKPRGSAKAGKGKSGGSGIEKIDLVVKDKDRKTPLRALEVKLTVMPDSTTKKLREAKWGSEIVIRSATTQYCALGMADALEAKFDEIRDLFDPVCSVVRDWANAGEVERNFDDIQKVCQEFVAKYYEYQKPLIMQPIWRTEGQSPLIKQKGAFDIFVWSDFAFTQLFINSPKGTPVRPGATGLTRYNRATAKFACFWYRLTNSKNGIDLAPIYRDITFDLQTDKEFSCAGIETNPYMACPRLRHPKIDLDKLYDIILDYGENRLMPERRLDQSVMYYSMKHPRP